jgi:type I restriction enzyme S subunit
MNSTVVDSKESGIPWIGKIPDCWDVKTLKRTTYVKGRIGWQGLTSEEYKSTGEYVLVTGTDFYDGLIDWGSCAYVDKERYEEDPYIQLREEDLLITKDGTIGKVALVKGLTKPATLNSGVFVTRPLNSDYRQKFMYWVLISDIFPEFIEFSRVGTTIDHLYQKTFERFVYPVPSVCEQERITTYLDASCAALDAAVAAKRGQLAILEGLCKATIQLAVTKGLDEHAELRETDNPWMESVPVGWGLVSLKRLVEIQTGVTLGKQYETPLIERPYLRVANVQQGYLDLEEVTTVEVPPAVAKAVELQAGDVLMTEGGDLDKLGRGVLWNGEIDRCLHQNHIFAVRCFRHKLMPEFLSYLTSSQYGRDYFEATGKRTTNLASTNVTKVGRFPVPLPSVEEQERIVRFLDERIGEIQRTQRAIEKQIEILNAYRKSLIHECVTGKRRITAADLKQVGAHG